MKTIHILLLNLILISTAILTSSYHTYYTHIPCLTRKCTLADYMRYEVTYNFWTYKISLRDSRTEAYIQEQSYIDLTTILLTLSAITNLILLIHQKQE